MKQKLNFCRRFKLLVWLRYTDDMFFIRIHGEKNLIRFMKDFNNFKSNLKFTFEHHRNFIDFLELNVKLYDGELTTIVYITPTYCHRYYHYRSYHPDHIKRSIVYSQLYRQVAYVHLKTILLSLWKEENSVFETRLP